ncbi:MAG: TIGR03915 family putative DNA repair protein [Synergistetes bacterium]|nr:TIGR03915 family putative DNA repair protein [Synergistota bacterium]MDW8191683.1 TIGR03915 family putative DNA repair protein [Synergistota bacterium]
MVSYTYDGTFEGFLCLIYKLLQTDLNLHEIGVENERLSPLSKGLFSEKIQTDITLAKSFYKQLREKLPEELFKKIYIYYLCDTAKLELPLTKLIKRIDSDPNAWRNITSDEAIKLYQAERAFNRERHRWLGLLRFVEIDERLLFAKFEPKFNVLPRIWNHFKGRFPNENFMIYDSLRKLLFKHMWGKGELLWIDNLDIKPSLTDPFIYLWKRYFEEIAIPERINTERQKSKLPLRARRFLPETWKDLTL